jgi:DNA-binding MarR family transcriptional regulator
VNIVNLVDEVSGMNIETMRKLVALVPLTFFRLQATGDRVHAARDLTTGLRGLLLSLNELGPMTASRLADIRPVSRQAIHKLAEQLIERGLVKQMENPRDKRAPLLALTERGRTEIARVRAAEDPQIRDLLRGLPDTDVEGAVRVLEAICDRLAPEEWRRLQLGAVKMDRGGRAKRNEA